MNGTFIVSQLGARRGYAVPRALHAAGMLERLYTDISAVRTVGRVLELIPRNIQPGAVKRLRGRVPHLPEDLVSHFPWLGLEAVRRRTGVLTTHQQTKIDIWAGKTFSALVNSRGFAGASGVYGFSGECLEQLVAARRASLYAVVDQVIAPRPIVDRLIREEEERYPHWHPPSGKDPLVEEYAARERAEWDATDVIVCGSSFVKDGVVACGGDASKCVVVPYGIDPRFSAPARAGRTGPLKVLTVGGVGLRKGSQYVADVARRLKGSATCRLVGPMLALPKALAELSDVLQLVPPVPRNEIAHQYAWADVFLLPSICEGSAAVTYEAMAAGLPVITTPNAGSVVRDGLDGFIVPIRNVEAIVDQLERLASDPDLYRSMSLQARARAEEHTVTAYGRRLAASLPRDREQARHTREKVHA